MPNPSSHAHITSYLTSYPFLHRASQSGPLRRWPPSRWACSTGRGSWLSRLSTSWWWWAGYAKSAPSTASRPTGQTWRPSHPHPLGPGPTPSSSPSQRESYRRPRWCNCARRASTTWRQSTNATSSTRSWA